MSEKTGFFSSLFDLSFTEFITTKIVTLLFVLAIIGSALGALMLIMTGFANSPSTGILALIFSPLVFLLYVIISRIYLEVIIVLFRIAENTGRLVRQNESE